MNSWVWEDSLTFEKAGVCEDPGAIGEVGWACEVEGRISEGPGMSHGSWAGRTERGANVDIVLGPGEYQTSTPTIPVFMIENIRTSQYDGCLDTFDPYGV
jgi:hypothetical protein